MPFKSEAQRRKFAELLKTGKLSKSTFDEWNKATPANIPQRVGKPQPPQKNKVSRPKRRA